MGGGGTGGVPEAGNAGAGGRRRALRRRRRDGCGRWRPPVRSPEGRSGPPQPEPRCPAAHPRTEAGPLGAGAGRAPARPWAAETPAAPGRAARPALGTGRLRAALRFRSGRAADGPGGPGAVVAPGGAAGPGRPGGAWPGGHRLGPRCRNHRLRAWVPRRRPVRGAGPRLRPVPHRPRRRANWWSRERAPVRGPCRGGVAVQLPPPVVLVTGGPSPLLAHPAIVHRTSRMKTGLEEKTGRPRAGDRHVG